MGFVHTLASSCWVKDALLLQEGLPTSNLRTEPVAKLSLYVLPENDSIFCKIIKWCRNSPPRCPQTVRWLGPGRDLHELDDTFLCWSLPVEWSSSVLQCVKNNHRGRVGQNWVKFIPHTGILAVKEQNTPRSDDKDPLPSLDSALQRSFTCRTHLILVRNLCGNTCVFYRTESVQQKFTA